MGISHLFYTYLECRCNWSKYWFRHQSTNSKTENTSLMKTHLNIPFAPFILVCSALNTVWKPLSCQQVLGMLLWWFWISQVWIASMSLYKENPIIHQVFNIYGMQTLSLTYSSLSWIHFSLWHHDNFHITGPLGGESGHWWIYINQQPTSG